MTGREATGRCLGCCHPSGSTCGGCGAFVDDGWDGTTAGREVTHDGFGPHPDLTLPLYDALAALLDELRVCCRDHLEGERLRRVEANVRWLLGRRV